MRARVREALEALRRDRLSIPREPRRPTRTEVLTPRTHPVRVSLPYVRAYAKHNFDDKTSSVYFMRDESGYIKIGFSGNVERRRKEIQSDPDAQGGNFPPQRIEVLATIPRCGRCTERMLHRAFVDSRASGEWFRADQELMRLVDEAKEGAA